MREEWFRASLAIGARCDEDEYQVWRFGAGCLATITEGPNSEDTVCDGDLESGSLWSSHIVPSPPPSRSPSPETGPGEPLYNKCSDTPLGTHVDDRTLPLARLSDLAGVDPSAIEKILELVAMPLRHPELYLHTGVQPPRRALLHGPPGCGKTLLVNAVAGMRTLQRVRASYSHKFVQDFGIPLIYVSASWLVSSVSGERDESLKLAFEEAKVGLTTYAVAVTC